jgi:hypothetical protein
MRRICLRREPDGEPVSECRYIFFWRTFYHIRHSNGKKTVKGKNVLNVNGKAPIFSIHNCLPHGVREWGFWFLIGLLPGGVGSVSAEVLMVTDFESGNFPEWTTFSTPNGTLGGQGFPFVAVCDHAGMVSPSRCLRVQVGQLHYAPVHDVQQGGGIERTTMTGAGILQLSARVGVTYDSPNKKRNLAGGLFEWVVDDQVVADLDVGPIEEGATVQHPFTGKVPVTAGPHTIKLRMTRPFQSGTGQPAPVQFVHDVLVELVPQP